MAATAARIQLTLYYRNIKYNFGIIIHMSWKLCHGEYTHQRTLRTLWKSPISKTWSGWQIARYRSNENATIVSTDEYEALERCQSW